MRVLTAQDGTFLAVASHFSAVALPVEFKPVAFERSGNCSLQPSWAAMPDTAVNTRKAVVVVNFMLPIVSGKEEIK